jgi:hypothetical protein
MDLQLMDATRAILGDVESKSGKKIKYIASRDLSMSAQFRMAGRQSTEHLLFYKPGHGALINYVIANQCGHILRILDAPEEKRYFPVANKKTMMCYMMETEDEINRIKAVMGDRIKQMIVMWYQGVVFQLTKMPPDIQIDRWIYDTYHELRPIQLQSLKHQLQNAIQGLSEDLRKIVPFKVYNVSNIMNYAFFKALESHFHLDFVRPYHRTIFLFEGSALARITEQEYRDGHEGDVAMINRWADKLEIKNWFEWKHINEMSADYIY